MRCTEAALGLGAALLVGLLLELEGAGDHRELAAHLGQRQALGASDFFDVLDGDRGAARAQIIHSLSAAAQHTGDLLASGSVAPLADARHAVLEPGAQHVLHGDHALRLDAVGACRKCNGKLCYLGIVARGGTWTKLKAAKPRADGRPRGDFKPAHIVEWNITSTMDWLAEHKSTREIVFLLGERGIAVRSAKRYLTLARHRFADLELLQDRTKARAMLIRAIEGDIAAARTDNAHGAIATGRRTQAQIAGAFAPEQHEHRGAIAHVAVPTPEGPPPLDTSDLTDDELAALRKAYNKLLSQAPAQLALQDPSAASGGAIEGEVVEGESGS